MGVFKRTVKNSKGKQTEYWYIRYSVNGKIKRESVGKVGIVTKDMARAKLDKAKRHIKSDTYDQYNTEIPTLNEITPEFIKYQKDVRQKRSIRDDVSSMKRFNCVFGDKKLSQITSKDIDDYKDKRLKEVKAISINKELTTLRRLFNLAKRWRMYYGENPVSESGLLTCNSQVERILKPKEEQKLLEISPSYFRNILVCALNTGMRKGELISLKWSNVDLETNLITLEHTNTKSKKTRRVPINSVLRKMLLEQKLKSSRNEYVFLNSEGESYKRSDSLNQVWRRILKKAGVEGLRFHDLRHTAATRMIESTGNIVAVNRILGHSDLRTTMRYMHPDNSLIDAVESLAVNFKNETHPIHTDTKSST